ncbi:glycosyltransferase family 4 protein [Moritella marina ATCC 15381]|uniref:Glycosyltransferase family 4 protein n=1 Tax=Moritella marina ATCC 15381 TaxID=1202962 RepID=A0A5J6WK07_MORMI|nr:glycosyltransferase family 4 protein [Moritella marina]QFI38377.1 glycosyltransferase family 4 protein [Moritella marina ATCC 15381]
MKKIALVLKGYPRLSETFIAQEIRALELRGFEITLVSLRHPTDTSTHPIHQQIEADVLYLPEYLHDEPLRVLKAFWKLGTQFSLVKVFKQFFRDLKRDTSRGRVRRFGQSLVLAAEMPEGVEQMYAHFLHTPASVTRYAALVNDLPWSCSAHAKDIWTTEQWDLSEKLAELEWLSTCTAANHSYLQSLAKDPSKVHLVYHGLDFTRFQHVDRISRADVNGSSADNPVKIISVGRAVPKKGYDDLLNALAKLPKDLHWQLTHIGGGGILKALRQQAKALGIEQHIEWQGAQPQLTVLEAYRESDLFVLASKIVADGDRDGMPNVLMEAQSQSVCCLATDISGIPELIDSGENGVLVESNNVAQLTAALDDLLRSGEKRERLGAEGQKQLHRRFDVKIGIDQLEKLFDDRG